MAFVWQMQGQSGGWHGLAPGRHMDQPDAWMFVFQVEWLDAWVFQISTAFLGDLGHLDLVGPGLLNNGRVV